MFNLYRVWNRDYKIIDLFAPTPAEAIDRAVGAKHIRRAATYKKITDCTSIDERALEHPALFAAARSAKISGVATFDRDAGWSIDGKLVAAE